MFNFARLSLGLVARCFRSRRRLLLENLALRQQLAVLKRRRARPKLSPFDKLFWVLACRFWTDWRRFLLVVTPETPCDCSERAAAEAPAFRVRLLPSRGPHASWTRTGNAGVPNSLRNLWAGACHDRLGGLHHRYDRAA
jgi:hypothetical protein